VPNSAAANRYSLPELVRMADKLKSILGETDCPAMDIPLTKLSKVGVQSTKVWML
jgi:hypothetical protein